MLCFVLWYSLTPMICSRPKQQLSNIISHCMVIVQCKLLIMPFSSCDLNCPACAMVQYKLGCVAKAYYKNPSNAELLINTLFNARLSLTNPSKEFFFCIAAKPAPRKRYGHRRVGSHGNPPIKIDPQYALAASQPQSHHVGGSSGISFSMSQSHPGEHTNHIAGDMFAPHPNLNHSRSWTPPENNMMATAYRQQRKPGIAYEGKISILAL